MKRVPIPFREITVQPLDAGCETKEQTLHLPAQTEIYVCVCVCNGGFVCAHHDYV